MTDIEIKERIEIDLKKFGETLILKEFIKTENTGLLNSSLKNIVGTTGSVSTTSLKISDTKEWVITDGQKTTNTISVTPVLEQ